MSLNGGTLYGWTKRSPEDMGYRKIISVSGLDFSPMNYCSLRPYHVAMDLGCLPQNILLDPIAEDATHFRCIAQKNQLHIDQNLFPCCQDFIVPEESMHVIGSKRNQRPSPLLELACYNTDLAKTPSSLCPVGERSC